MNQKRWTVIKIIVGAGISFPLFTSALNISISKIKVSERVVVGGKYALEFSTNQTDWVAEPEFVAQGEQYEREVTVEGESRFFRLRTLELPPVTVEIPAIQDTSIFEGTPRNNTGAMLTLEAGGTETNGRARVLIRFDQSFIPVGSQVLNAKVEFHAVSASSGPPSAFGIYRVLSWCAIGPFNDTEGPWPEGLRGAEQFDGAGEIEDGTGRPGATWIIRHKRIAGHLSIGWCEGGLGAGMDHMATVSATTVIGDVGTYEFTSSELAADVQFWVDNPWYLNDGWLLKSEDENTTGTARRFASREHPTSNFRPRLIVEYLPPVGQPMQPQNSTPAPALAIIK